MSVHPGYIHLVLAIGTVRFVRLVRFHLRKRRHVLLVILDLLLHFLVWLLVQVARQVPIVSR